MFLKRLKNFADRNLVWVLFTILSTIFFSAIFLSMNNHSARPRTETVSFWPTEAFPLSVYTEDVLRPDHTDGVLAAMDFWNITIGREVFDMEINPGRPRAPYNISIFQKPYGKSERNPTTQRLGYAYFFFGPEQNRRSKMLIGCKVGVWSELQTRFWKDVLVHEFGHCLGLGHVPNKDSIMYEYILERQQISVERQTILRLRQLYDTRMRGRR